MMFAVLSQLAFQSSVLPRMLHSLAACSHLDWVTGYPSCVDCIQVADEGRREPVSVRECKWSLLSYMADSWLDCNLDHAGLSVGLAAIGPGVGQGQAAAYARQSSRLLPDAVGISAASMPSASPSWNRSAYTGWRMSYPSSLSYSKLPVQVSVVESIRFKVPPSHLFMVKLGGVFPT